MFEYIGIIIISIIARIFIVRNADVNHDTYGHLYFAKEISEQNVGPFGKIRRKIVGSTLWGYPFLWHWLLGKLPFNNILQIQKWINPFLDIIYTIIIYLVARLIHFSSYESIIIVLFYLFTPMWFSCYSMGPRINSLTPRLFSEIMTNLFFIVVLLPLNLPVWTVLFLGACLSSIVLLSSRFGLQALLFLTAINYLLTHDATQVIALCFGIMISIIISKGQFIKTVQYQFFSLKQYFIKNLKKKMSVSNRNNIKLLFKRTEKNKSLWYYLLSVVMRGLTLNSISGLLLKLPIIIIPLFLFFDSNVNKIDYALPLYFIGPVISGLILFTLVNLPWFLFLGEAERYLNHISFFILATSVFIISSNHGKTFLFIILAYGILFWLIEIVISHFRATVDDKKMIDKNIISLLNSFKKEIIILSYPYHAVGIWRILLETKHKVVRGMTGNNNFDKYFESNYADNYPYVKLDVLDRMHDELGVNFLIINNKHLERRNVGWVPSALWKKLEIGEPFYTVYAINE